MTIKQKELKSRDSIKWISVNSITWEKMIEQIEKQGRSKLLNPGFLPQEFTLHLKNYSFPLVCRIQDIDSKTISFWLPFSKIMVKAKIKSDTLEKDLELEYISNTIALPKKLTIELISFRTVQD